ncbi:MAG: hypothetical protein ABEI06_00445 [Halobacteriaceae archaeon]
MGRTTDALQKILRIFLLPIKLIFELLGSVIAIFLLLLVPVVVVAATTMAWYLPFYIIERVVNLPLLIESNYMNMIGMSATVAGVPVIYPLSLGILTAILIGWPDPDYESDIDSTIFQWR